MSDEQKRVEMNMSVNRAVAIAAAADRKELGSVKIMPATWAQYQVSADPAKPGAPPDPDDPWDAIFTAAHYLNASGAPADWPTALYAYNHAAWYVAQAQQLAQHYAQTASSAVPTASGVPQPACVTPGPTTPGITARILPAGLAASPHDAPAQVQAAITAGNRIIDTSYSQERQPNMLTTVMPSYDCSGSTDFVLYNADSTLRRSTLATGSPATRECSKATATPAPAPATGSPSTPPPGTRSSRSPESCSTPPTGRPPPHPAAAPRWQPTTILPSQLADGNTWTERHPPGL